MSDDTDEIVAFCIDDMEFNLASTAEEGTWEDDARPMPFPYEITERYEVVRQQVPGFMTITQAVEPVALKVLHFVVTTFTKDDLEFMDSLNNYRPHEVQSHLLRESPILMYLESKLRRPPKTGMQQFGIEWDVTMVQCNDNNSV